MPISPEIKVPAEATNNQSYEEQICRYLDRLDKCLLFGIALSMEEQQLDQDDINAMTGDIHNATKDDVHNALGDDIDDSGEAFPVPSQNTRSAVNYFDIATLLMNGSDPNAPRPFRTFVSASSAFHLNRRSSFKQLDVDEVAVMFQLPDLRPAIEDYLQRAIRGMTTYTIGGPRRAAPWCHANFPKLEVWTNFRIQSKSVHKRKEPVEARTVNCAPPSEAHPFGLYDSVLVNTDPAMTWPWSGFQGTVVCLSTESSTLNLIRTLCGSSAPSHANCSIQGFASISWNGLISCIRATFQHRSSG
jgi:hypothetical protein